jgi:uncharacterized protein GlcG (DUF336 family)
MLPYQQPQIRRIPIMKLTHTLALMAGAAVISVSAWAQESLPTQKVLTIDVAQTIAQDAMAQCRANGYKVTVTVVDHANVLKAFLHDDGASMATVEVGRMKANNVMAFGRPSGPPANLPAGAPVPAPVLPGTINAMGGVPIKVGDQLVGAVSVSGAPGGDKDAACANAALAKVADKLK